MGLIYEAEIQVDASHLDDNEHVNNVVYVDWMQKIAVAHSEMQGWPASRYRQLEVSWVARSHHVEYLQPVHRGDVILVKSWVVDMEKISSRRRYEFVSQRHGTIVCQAQTTWVLVNSRTGRPVRIAEEIRQNFQCLSDHEGAHLLNRNERK